MSEVHVRDGESIDAALKRFRNACNKEGIKDEVKKRRYYRNPSTLRKEQKQARERKARRKLLRNEQKAMARRYGRPR
jgi:small subunit ribosomal protein S21